jgi:hypothetical protein
VFEEKVFRCGNGKRFALEGAAQPWAGGTHRWRPSGRDRLQLAWWRDRARLPAGLPRPLAFLGHLLPPWRLPGFSKSLQDSLPCAERTLDFESFGAGPWAIWLVAVNTGASFLVFSSESITVHTVCATLWLASTPARRDRRRTPGVADQERPRRRNPKSNRRQVAPNHVQRLRPEERVRLASAPIVIDTRKKASFNVNQAFFDVN